MPYSNTIRRAISVTFSRSFDGAVRDTPEDELLRRPAREGDLHHVEQLLLGVQVAILDREVVGEPERVSATDDRHLLDGHHAPIRCAISAWPASW